MLTFCLVPASCHTPSLYCDEPECPWPCGACILEGGMGRQLGQERKCYVEKSDGQRPGAWDW